MQDIETEATPPKGPCFYLTLRRAGQNAELPARRDAERGSWLICLFLEALNLCTTLNLFELVRRPLSWDWSLTIVLIVKSIRSSQITGVKKKTREIARIFRFEN